jgi:TolB-like protein/Flp pilus assembly protein TadD
MSLWTELKRRNVVRVGAAYVLVAWIVLQVLDFTLDVIDAPNWIMQLLVVMAAIGLVGAAIFAWVFEMTPEGLKRESDVDRSASVTTETGKKLNIVIMGTLVLAVAVLGYRQFLAPEVSAPTEQTQQAAAPSEDDLSRKTAVPSIAVMPFEDFSEEGDQEYFSKGIAEEMLNLLAKTDALRVAARTSSFALAGTGADIRDIGEKLDVDTVLEGSIRKAGDQIRVTAQLINVEDGYHVWSETYDRQYEDIFQIQDEITAAIMTSLRVHLLGDAEQRMHAEVARDMDAYSAYLIGRERMALRTEGSLRDAVAQFEKAITLDPAYAPPRVQLAHAWLLLEEPAYGGDKVDPADVDRIVEPQLATALQLTPDSPEAIAVKGLHDLKRNQYDDAKAAFDRAIALNPNYADAYAWRAEIAYHEERFLDLLADKEKAYALDPMSLQLSAELAAEYRNFWRPEDAERVIDRMFELHPHHPLAYSAAIFNLGYHGRYADAVLMLEQALEAHPENENFQHGYGHALLLLGLFEEAEKIGDKDVLVESAVLSGDMELARERLTAGLATGEDLGKWLSAGRFLNLVDKGEGSAAQLRALVQRSLDYWDSRNYDWSSDCWPALIYQMKEAGLATETKPMMSECERSMEERFKARYLCPCMMYGVVQYTILSGRLEEAVERADYWLSNGDSYYALHLDPIFSQLSSHPRYAELLTRNAAHQARQRELYLANRNDSDPSSALETSGP